MITMNSNVGIVVEVNIVFRKKKRKSCTVLTQLPHTSIYISSSQHHHHQRHYQRCSEFLIHSTAFPRTITLLFTYECGVRVGTRVVMPNMNTGLPHIHNAFLMCCDVNILFVITSNVQK